LWSFASIGRWFPAAGKRFNQPAGTFSPGEPGAVRPPVRTGQVPRFFLALFLPFFLGRLLGRFFLVFFRVV